MTIGVFDSGLGGLTAVKSLLSLTNCDIVYLGDTLRVPYGDKERSELLMCAESDINFLLSKGVDCVLIACGSVSSSVDKEFLSKFSVPVFEVLTPAVEKAIKTSQNKKIGIIATAASIRAGAFERLLKESDQNIEVFPVACPKLVPLIEGGKFKENDDEIKNALKEYLSPLKENKIDTLILGCTHYPLLKNPILNFLGDVNLIDIGCEAAKKIEISDKIGDRTLSFYVSGDAEVFKTNAEHFLNFKVEKVEKAVL